MLLSIPGVQYAKRVALMLSMLLLGVTFGVPEASAAEEEAAVTVSPGETSCYYLQRRVTNPTEQWVAAMSYEIRNDVREDYPEVVLIPPRGEHDFRTDEKHYFQHSLGVKAIALSAGPGSMPVGEWSDWEAVEYMFPADCPQMIAEPKLMKRLTSKATLGKRPRIGVKTTAYRTDFGYRVGKQRKIRWLSLNVGPGFGPVFGPAIKFGKVKRVQVCWRTRDDASEKSAIECIDKPLRFKRGHSYP